MTNQETIKELEMDIQELKANLSNGWHIGTKQSKNDILSELEYKKNKAIILKQINN